MIFHVFGLLALTSTLSITLTSATWTYEGTTVTLALVNYTYRDPRRDGVLVEVGQVGKYAPGQVVSASGRVVVDKINMADELNEVNERNCDFPWSSPSPAPPGSWVALMKGKGRCSDKDKVEIAAANNATAVILYTSDPHAHLRKIQVDYPDLAVVWVGEEEGRGLQGVVEGGAEVVITLDPGHNLRYHVTSVNRTSVLFVSVSFIILMAISLAWLVFYYVQRFRYIHAKDRLARHLCNAAKKALAKIPVKTLKATDREVSLDGECCAVCIEHYQVGEAIRTLPCKHEFHRCCVDPWLLEHRTCPMCKMDILKHYGYVLSESEESVLQLDMREGGDGTHLGGAVGQGGMDSTTHPLGPHTPRAAPHLTPVVMVPRSDGGGMGAEGEMERPLPDMPISPTHTSVPPMSPSSLLSLHSSSCKGTPEHAPHPHHTPSPHTSTSSSDGDSLNVDVPLGCSDQRSTSATPEGAMGQSETCTFHPPLPKRSKRRSLPDLTSQSDTLPAVLTPASHIVSVSHF